ncbi:MAG TPA: amidohydrolase family protein, partial [Acidimicrobiia bacterium]|nr:amidohydrolase family protein [Acidimicrobiia bacterium]
PREVADRLAAGHVGLKLHPGVGHYHADDPRLDPFVERAAQAKTAVAIHTGPGNSDPARIARLAARFPTVPFVLYHTYLGSQGGKRKAVRLARDHENLFLETSWCGWHTIERLIADLGPQRVIFGSDAPVDGFRHYALRNLEGHNSYKDVMCWMSERLDTETARAIMSDNARRLFHLGPASNGGG